ncbi:MAG: phosphoribosylanthranilate isomerase [Rhodospirillales bacterium]
MTAVAAKICGVNTRAALDAAVAGGARWVGFVFFPRSPRHVSFAQAAELSALLPPAVTAVGLVVDPDDAMLRELIAAVPLGLLQLHGGETPDRIAAIRALAGLPVMKAIKVATAADLAPVPAYAAVADRILFDAKAPPGLLPGGNALSFDWTILAGRTWPGPWMLSGGLTPENVAEAVRITGAHAVDVSSGVEAAPGTKDPARIAAFLRAVAAL